MPYLVLSNQENIRPSKPIDELTFTVLLRLSETQVTLSSIIRVTLIGLMTGQPGVTHGTKKPKLSHETPQ